MSDESTPTYSAAPTLKPRLFFMRPGLQWMAVLCSLAAPAAYVSYATGLSEHGAALTIIIAPAVFLLYLAADVFDPGAFPSPGRPNRVMGYILKLLAMGHAVGAIKFAYHMFSPDEIQPVDMPFLAKLAIIKWLWLVAALAYMCGDAHIHSVKHRQT